MGNEYTVTCRHGNAVYRGSSRSEYNYHRNTYTGCSTCHYEDNQESQRKAEMEARRRRDEEEERVGKRARELEKLERERQEKREKERKLKYKQEQEALRQQRIKDTAERETKRKEMEEALKMQQEELEEAAERLKKSKLQTADPFLQYKQLNTLQTIKEIATEVTQVAVVGEIVKERYLEVSKDLVETLGDDYKLIETEMNRYKKYGEEMSNMTNVFKTEINKALNSLDPNAATNLGDLQNEANEYDKMLNEEDEDDMKECCQSKKKDKLTQLKDKLKALDGAIKAIDAKLRIMESYYEQMVEDYKYFATFIDKKDDELSEVIQYFQTVADQLKKEKDRSKLFVHSKSHLYDDYYSKPQITSFTEEYEIKETNSQKTGIGFGSAVAVGAIGGAMLGGVIGGLCGGPAGLLIGAAAGMAAGAATGAIVHLCNKPEYKVGYTTRTGSITVTSELITYKNKEQAEALEKIIKEIEESKTYQNMKQKLEENRNMAKEQKNELKKLKTNMLKIQKPLTDYKMKMKDLKTRLNSGTKLDEQDTLMIDKQLQKLSAEMLTMIKTMDK